MQVIWRKATLVFDVIFELRLGTLGEMFQSFLGYKVTKKVDQLLKLNWTIRSTVIAFSFLVRDTRGLKGTFFQTKNKTVTLIQLVVNARLRFSPYPRLFRRRYEDFLEFLNFYRPILSMRTGLKLGEASLRQYFLHSSVRGAGIDQF